LNGYFVTAQRIPHVLYKKRNTLNRHRCDPEPLFAIILILAKLVSKNKDYT